MMHLKTKQIGRLLGGAAIALAAGVVATSTAAQSIRVWTTETQPARLERQQQMAADYQAATGVEVEMIPVDEQDYGTRATAAFAAGDLPDVIYLPLQYALPWAEAGILDTEAATEVFNDLGEGTFAPGAVSMAAYDGGIAAVPTGLADDADNRSRAGPLIDGNQPSGAIPDPHGRQSGLRDCRLRINGDLCHPRHGGNH